MLRIYHPVGDDETIIVDLHTGEHVLPLYSGPLEAKSCLLIKNATIVAPNAMRKALRIN